MSTPNIPAPVTPEWLLTAAADIERRYPVIAFALRAAAERIEQLELASKDLIKLAAEYDEENDRLRAENEVLRKAITAWAQATRMRCLLCDEDHDAAPCSCFDDLAALERAENALRELAADPARKEGA